MRVWPGTPSHTTSSHIGSLTTSRPTRLTTKAPVADRWILITVLFWSISFHVSTHGWNHYQIPRILPAIMSSTNASISPPGVGGSQSTGRETQRGYQNSPGLISPFPETQIGPQGPSDKHGKKRRHRPHRRRRHRRPSFAPATVESSHEDTSGPGPGAIAEGRKEAASRSPVDAHRAAFYRLGQLGGTNSSQTSLDTEVFMDHRYTAFLLFSHLRMKESLTLMLFLSLLQESTDAAPTSR